MFRHVYWRTARIVHSTHFRVRPNQGGNCHAVCKQTISDIKRWKTIRRCKMTNRRRTGIKMVGEATGMHRWLIKKQNYDNQNKYRSWHVLSTIFFSKVKYSLLSMLIRVAEKIISVNFYQKLLISFSERGCGMGNLEKSIVWIMLHPPVATRRTHKLYPRRGHKNRHTVVPAGRDAPILVFKQM